jgi:translation initiation factor IF-3
MEKNNKFNKNKQYAKHRINSYINTNEVRLIGDNIENSGNVITLDKALGIARSMSLDLVEVSPNANPPIVRIVDYKKFLYEEEKKQKELEKKQKENNKPIKEVQFTPNIGNADIETKTKNIKGFLKDNHKVKIVMKFKQGREMNNLLEKGELIVYQLLKNLEDVSKPEALPKLVGKSISVTINPKK